MSIWSRILVCIVLGANVGFGSAADAPKKRPPLEHAVRAWHKGIASEDKKDREAALQSMMASPKDIEYLFPKHAEKLKPILAKGNKGMLDNVDKIAVEMTKAGEIKSVTVMNVREKDPNGRCKRVFEMIPKDVPVFNITVRYANLDASGREYFLFVNNRWIWINGLDVFPQMLQKLK